MTPNSTIVGSPTIGMPMLVAMHPAKMRKAKLRFKQHRDNAKRRDILFLFGFPLWIGTWWESGHWFERGRCQGQWVMARRQDRGAYEIGNVTIITNAANVVEAFGGKPMPAATRAKIARTKKGLPSPFKGRQHTKASIEKMRLIAPDRARAGWVLRRAEARAE
jgi:NUMOD3 motif